MGSGRGMTSIRQTGAAQPPRIVGEAGVKLTTFIPVQFKKRGARTVIVLPDAAHVQAGHASLGKIPPACDTTLLIALGRAFHWQRFRDRPARRITSFHGQ